MEPMVIAKQMIDLQKAAFDNSFNAMLLLQEQTERTVNMFSEQATWLPEEWKKVLAEWVKAYNKGYDDFKKLVDENFKSVGAFLAEVETPEVEKAKTKKTPKTKSE